MIVPNYPNIKPLRYAKLPTHIKRILILPILCTNYTNYSQNSALNKVNSSSFCYKSQMREQKFSEILQLILKRVKDRNKISALC
jgi:hypothetical protein